MIDEVFSIYQHTKPDWPIKPLGQLCIEVRKQNLGDIESNLLSLSYGQIIDKDLENAKGLVPDSYETYNIVEPGDVVLRLTDLQNDKKSLRVGQVQSRGIITSAYTTLRSKGALDPRWLYYTLHAYDLEKYFYSMGSGLRQSMKFDDLKHLPIAVPSQDTQKLITQHLDERVSKAKELKESIELLASATEASFRSLIDSQMSKISEQIKLKYVCAVQSGNSLSAEYIEEHELHSTTGKPFIATKDLDYLGNISEEIEISIPDELQAEFRTTKPGDVLICSEGGSAGRKFAITKTSANYGNKLFACRMNSNFHSSFLFYFFYSQQFKNQFNKSLNGLIGGISKESFGDIKLPYASRQEQERLVELFTDKFEDFKTLSAALAVLRDKTEEMSRNLISNSLTGAHTITETKRGA